MILFFSGTGNSEYVARRIARITKDNLVSINESIRKNETQILNSSEPWIFVVPTYAWRIPHIVEEWVHKCSFTGNKKAYFVMTCGSETGNAEKYLRKLCEGKQFEYMGCAEIVMPENYITLFKAPDRNDAIDIIQKADPVITRIAELIQNGHHIDSKKISWSDRLMSGLVNWIFYPLFVSAKKFYVTADCVGCGICEKKCPLNNIGIKNGKPEWGENCTQCMACICDCPKEAIEYGKRSKGKVRYHCPIDKLGQ